jgi:diguanylate cyclase (GGDEF)-like protein/PAS domain S-box-containing protein
VVLEHSADIVIVIDGQARLLYANAAAEATLGRRRDEVLGAAALDLVHPDDVGLAVESLGGTTATGPGTKVPINLRIGHSDGSWRRLEMIATNMLDDPDVGGIVLGARDVTDRPEIERRLHAFEQRFEAAFEHAPLGRALLERDGRLMRVNQSFCRLVERRPEELTTLRIAELFPDCPELAIPDSPDSPDSKGPLGSLGDLRVESRIGRSDGAAAWLSIAVTPVHDEDNVVHSYNVFVDDITELRAAEAELRRAETAFRALVAHSSDIITVLEPDGAWRSSSAAGTRLLGYAEGINPEGGIFSLLHPDDVELATRSFTEVIEGRRADDEPIVLRVRSADGSRLLFLETVARNLVDDPAVRGIVLNSRDVTERVAAEEALRSSEERFRALVQESQDLIVVLDASGRVDYVSPAGERIFGRTAEETRGVDGTSLLHPDDLEGAMTSLAEVTAEPGRVGQIEVRVAHSDGSYRVVDAIGQNRLDDPSVRGIVLNIRDTTERVTAETELHTAQERFRALARHATDLVTIVDGGGLLTYVSPSVTALLGYQPSELEGTDGRSLVHPDDLPRFLEVLGPEPGGAFEPMPIEYRVRTHDGEWRTFEGVTTNLLDEPSVAGFVTNARDVTDRREAEREAARLTEVLERSNEVVVISDPAGKLVYANQRAKEFLGIGDEHHVGELSSVESRERLRDEIMPLVRRHGLWNGELTLRTAEGDEVPTVATLQGHREHGELVLISTIAHDITELKRAQHRLEYEASHDALTGLPNRAMLLEVGEQALGRAARHGTITGVLFLDLDGFKEINDALGHDAGDRVLVELGRSLRVGVRTGDLVARLGGDEFCVLCEAVESEQELRDLGQRICDVVATPMRVHGRDVQVGTSVGIALDRAGSETIGGLVRNADVALYRAKRAGGSRVALFDPTLENVDNLPGQHS